MDNLEKNKKQKNIIHKASIEDLGVINKKLIEKFKENNIKYTSDNIYSELELIKKDPHNSFIYDIIKKYMIECGHKPNKHYIISSAIKLFETEYKGVIKKYKEDRKKEFNIKNKRKGKKTLLPFEGNEIEVPTRIGHGYIPLKMLPLKELETKYSRHKRLKVFHNKGLKCVTCDKTGVYLIAARDRGGSIHVDVYTKDFNLMTVDHIKPKSKGGTYDLENLDPMCAKCNTNKADKYVE